MKSCIVSALLLSTSLVSAVSHAKNADTIYYGGSIITIDENAPSAEAVAVSNGKIVAVGKRKAVLMAEKGPKTKLVDIKGRTLIPGFVDAHGHFSEVGLQTVSANLLPPPDGTVKNIADLQQVMRDYIKSSPVVKKHGIVIGMNYDDSQLAEGRHPTRQDLDQVSTDLPIMVVHQSGHFGAMNSVALAKVGVTATSVDPDGGVIRREADGTTPNGVLEENGFFMFLYKMFPPFSTEEMISNLMGAQDIYVANGFTTIQDGKTTASSLSLLEVAARKGLLKSDINSYPALDTFGDAPVLHGPLNSRTFKNHLRIAGVKLTLDGSPQGKSGFFTQPYVIAPDGQKSDYRGYPAFTDAKLQEWTDLAYKNQWQLLMHVSGDAAGDQMIAAVSEAQKKYGYADSRTVMIHGHYIRNDQVPKLKELGVFPALFPMHTFNWGDWHRQSVAGADRAANISPTRWFIDAGMKVSIHADAPVVFPNSMQLVGTAVNRTTRSGFVLGSEHRLSPLEALRAMTLWPAYQHFEEKMKGSIEVGKLADFVILSANPLTIAPAKINTIKIDETIKEGKTIYKRN